MSVMWVLIPDLGKLERIGLSDAIGILGISGGRIVFGGNTS